VLYFYSNGIPFFRFIRKPHTALNPDAIPPPYTHNRRGRRLRKHGGSRPQQIPCLEAFNVNRMHTNQQSPLNEANGSQSFGGPGPGPASGQEEDP